MVTTASSAAFVLAFLALFDAGARVGLPSPGYPCYRHILTSLGCRPVEIETGPQTRWMPAQDQVAALVNGLDGGLLVASLANPTGTMLTPQRLAALVALCRDNGLWFISDEIYHGLTWDQPAESALQYGDDVIVINSFSKYYSMTGWLVVPPALAHAGAARPEPLHRPARRGAGCRARRRSRQATSWRPTGASMPPTVRCCSRSCPRQGSTVSRPPTAPSTSTPT